MKLKGVFILAALLMAGAAGAQDLKITVDKKGRVGFADSSGKEVIKCQYESALPFKNGVAIVTKSGKQGMIDENGKVVMPLKYTQITPWTDNLYLIKDKKTVGLASLTGKIVVDAKYSLISKPNCYGKALIAVGGKATANDKKTYMANAKYGIIDSDGKIIITPQYKGLYEFAYDGKNTYPYYEGKRLLYSYHNTVDTLVTDCSYLGYSGNGWNIYGSGVIDGQGKVLLKSGLYSYVMLPHNNMVRYYLTKSKKDTRCGYHDLSTGKGFEVSKYTHGMDNFTIWSHGDFVGNIAPVNGSAWSFIDKSGKTIRQGYKSIKHGDTVGKWAAKTSAGTWDVFDESNSDIAALTGFEDILFQKNKSDKEVYVVKKDGKYGAVDKAGNVIVPFEYESAFGNMFDFIPVKKDGNWGIVTATNTPVIPTEYTNLMFPTEKNTTDFWVQKSDSLYYHYNTRTNTTANTGYKGANSFKDGLAFVVPANLTIPQTQVNKAQLWYPNATAENLAASDLVKHKDSFGIIINTDDATVMDLPITSIYLDEVKKRIKEHGNKPLTSTEKKNIMLEVTRENRSYNLQSTISEDDWNY